jgi:D-sedoheptulose 7-phosphate isomerase
VLTAAGNDYGFERIFARQIESMVAPSDVLVALSTSGQSQNIIRGVEAGRTRGAYLVALTGETGGALASKVDLLLNVPSRDPQRIQGSAYHYRAHRLLADRTARQLENRAA